MKRSAQKINILRRVLALLSALLLLPLPVRAAAGVDVGCYAAVNGSWRLVETVRVTETSDIFGTSRYFIGADELQRVYADYGFAAADLASEDDPLVGKRYFAHTVEGDLSQIWADALPRRESADGELLIPLGDSKKQLHTYLYYLPKNEISSASYFEEKKPIGNAQLLADNSFYSLEVSDPGGLVYETGALPEEKIYGAGEEMTCILPAPEGVRWDVRDAATGETVGGVLTDNGDGTVTFYAAAAARGIRLVAERDGFSVRYTANLAGRLQPLGCSTHDETQYSYPATMQVITEDATIRGAAHWTDLPDGAGGITLAAPDTDRAEAQLDKSQVGDYKGRRYYYTFGGWEAETGEVYPAGTVFTAGELEALDADGDSVVDLRATWHAADGQGRIESVNLYVNKTCEIADNLTDGYATGDGSANFTPVIFGTRVFGMENLDFNIYTPYLLTAKIDAAATAYAVDAQIRGMTTEPLQGVTLENLPTDEDVLAYLRSTRSAIFIDGVKIPYEDLTTERFKVRWATLKYEPHDGWHLDGILVAKAGRLAVTKTFAGDAAAIAAVKETWSGTVTHIDAETGETVTDFTLELSGANSHDEETDTYTWTLPVRQGREYLVGEEGYVLSGDWQQSAQYAIRGSAAETAGFLDYTGPVAVTAESYPSDVPDSAVQTVAFENLYVQAGLFTLHKIDDGTGTGIAGVQFTLSRADAAADESEEETETEPAENVPAEDIPDVPGEAAPPEEPVEEETTKEPTEEEPAEDAPDDGTLTVQSAAASLAVYRVPGTSRYFAFDPDMVTGELTDYLGEYTEAVADGVLETDAGGWLYLHLSPLDGTTEGVYSLRERVPVGYFGASELALTVTDDGAVAFSAEVTDAGDAEPPEGGWLSGSGSVYTLRNASRRYVSVTAEKLWSGGAAAEDSVTVELWRNGARMVGAEYTQVLSDGNGWSYTWTDLPLFQNGHVAEYALREVLIGATAYDPGADAADGYADYVVTHLDPQYWCGSEFFDTEPVQTAADGTPRYADALLLRVENALVHGEVSFAKTDEQGSPLAGAEFTLYADAACKTAVAAAVSDAGGIVAFEPLPVGTYYLRETAAPAGYAARSDQWRVVVRATGSAVYAADGSAVSAIANRSRMSLLLRKTDPGGAALTGAEFTLWRNDKPYGSFAVDGEGCVRLDALPAGDYTIEETEAPAGFVRSTAIATLRISGGEVTLLEPEALPLWLLSGPEGGCWTLTVRNEPLWVIPSVGGPGIYPMMALGAALMALAAAGLLLALRRRKR